MKTRRFQKLRLCKNGILTKTQYVVKTSTLRLKNLFGFLGGIRNYNEWLRRGQSQLADDPCVWFRHEEVEIMSKLCQSSVYDLTAQDKLKLLVLLCNQSLTLSSVRDYMEEAAEK